MPILQSPKPRKKRAPKAAPPVEGTYAKNAETFFRGAADEKKCGLAFEKLLNGVSYAGMAEAEAKRGGKSGAEFAKQTADAVKRFKITCKLED
jgi:hypothetical protein